MIIEKVSAHQMRIPLRKPYRLAFGQIDAFDTILVRIFDRDGREGMGEATLLAGYTDETLEGSWRLACTLGQAVVGSDFTAAKEEIDAHYKAAPFTVTAFVTALEMIEGHPLLDVDHSESVPILGLVYGEDEREWTRSIERELEDGYKVLKVKVGFDAEADLKRVGVLQRILGGRAQIRLDANQGYSAEAGAWFASRVSPEGVELFEQPCAAGDWDGACAVARVSQVPMMLDESIYGLDDIARAAELNAAAFIKLKLMKMGGLTRLEEGVRFIREHGMEPVLGNGVAGDIGCWMEACAARSLITNAGEMNGSLKPNRSLLRDPLTVRRGRIILEPDFTPRISTEALSFLEQMEMCF